MSLREIDYGPLLNPISREDVREFARRTQVGPAPFRSRGRVVAASIAQIIVSSALIVIALAFTAFLLGDVIERRLDLGVVLLVAGVCVLLGGALVFYALWTAVRRIHLRNPWPRRARLARFATVNGLDYLPTSIPPNVHSSVFGHDESSWTTDRFIWREGEYREVGNFHRPFSSWLASPNLHWGYMLIDLGVELPHMVLRSRDVRRRHPAKSIPVAFAAGQVLGLEGDFDKHFTLFAPSGYERDALYVFSPDLMALLIDEVSTLEIEIVDRWLLVYSPQPLDLASAGIFARLMLIADVVGRRLSRQTQRYSDHRTPDLAVGAHGRRLRTRIAVVSILAIAFWVAYFAARAVQVTYP